MSIRTYKQVEAQRLIPFFQSIANEVGERRNAIHRLEVEQLDSPADSDHAIQTQADRANHRKELRLALREITRLGCKVTREYPLRVLIPGPQGDSDGFHWSTGQKELEPAAAETAA